MCSNSSRFLSTYNTFSCERESENNKSIIKYNYELRGLPLRRVLLGKLTSFYRPEIKIMIRG